MATRSNAADPRRAQILAVAASVVARKGFDAARLRDVANEGAVSIGLLQHYFETRDKLFVEAFGWSIDELLARWLARDHGSRDPVTRLSALIEELAHDPRLVQRSATWIEFCASATRHPQLRPGVQRVYTAWRSLIGEVIDEGVATGDFHLTLGRGEAIELLCALVDGLDLGAANGAQDAASYTSLVRNASALALGCPRLAPRSIEEGPDAQLGPTA